MTMDWHSSVRTHNETLDNEAHNQDEHIATWYMIPWINIPRNFLSLHKLLGFKNHSKYTDGFEWRESMT